MPVHQYTMIDEVESANGAITLEGGNYWFTTAAAKCSIAPATEPGGTELPEPRDGDALGMHFTGPACTTDWGAQSGMTLQTGPAKYDASAFTGVAFYAKMGAAGVLFDARVRESR